MIPTRSTFGRQGVFTVYCARTLWSGVKDGRGLYIYIQTLATRIRHGKAQVHVRYRTFDALLDANIRFCLQSGMMKPVVDGHNQSQKHWSIERR